ncbi:MAG: hypothetical protein Kow00124_15190 [Anaerolineae bacterium]
MRSMRQQVNRSIPIIAAATLAVLAVAGLAVRQQVRTQIRYFPETGHIVREPLLEFFEQHGGISTFGYPLTEAYTDEDGYLTQIFEHAMLQLTVRGVALAPVGERLNLGSAALGAAVDPVFAAYYRERGGESFLGPPLNEARIENGLLVQDFQRARLMRGPTGEIGLADLGAVYLAIFPPPVSQQGQAAIRPQGTPLPPVQIRASVSVEQPTVGQGEQQTIYLYVHDSRGQPVAGAHALAVLRYNEATAEVELLPTDENGLSRATFIVPPALPGTQVIVTMHVLAGETLLTVETAYFQWW